MTDINYVIFLHCRQCYLALKCHLHVLIYIVPILTQTFILNFIIKRQKHMNKRCKQVTVNVIL